SRCTQQDQRSQEFWPPGCQPHPDKTSHRKPGKMTWRATQCLNQSSGILVEGIHVIAIMSDFTSSLTTKVKRNAPIAILERIDLRLKHLPVPQQTMSKQNG